MNRIQTRNPFSPSEVEGGATGSHVMRIVDGTTTNKFALVLVE